MAARWLPQEPREVNAYEEERRLRIQRNQAVLQNLGLVDNPLSAAAEAQEQAQRRQQQQAQRQRERQAAAGRGEPYGAVQPTRRSSRLAGEQHEFAALGALNMRPIDYKRQHPLCRAVRDVAQEVAEQRHRLPSLNSGNCSKADLDRHNSMRIRSMSEKALRTRIWKITRVDKLRSFIQMLDACCMGELAAEARRALRQLTGGLDESSSSEEEEWESEEEGQEEGQEGEEEEG